LLINISVCAEQKKLHKERVTETTALYIGFFNRKETNHLPGIISIVAKVSITLNVENEVNK
jgi:hypothetical protein